MTQETLLQEIDSMIQALSSPLPTSEIKEGWTPESQAAMLQFFQDLKAKILKEETLPYLSISRGMDFWGITGGKLIDKAAFISVELNKIYHPTS